MRLRFCPRCAPTSTKPADYVCLAIDRNAGHNTFSDVHGARWLRTDEKRIDRFFREAAHFLD